MAISLDKARGKDQAAPLVDFVRKELIKDLKTGRYQKIATRFPPEPNGYLHIGHAKAICLNFEIAAEFNGVCWLRMDDTNPAKEDLAYVSAIQEDIRWLGFDWNEKLSFASDYFDRLYEIALKLVQKGLAYVDSQDSQTIRQQRGTFTAPGQQSPYRERSVAQNEALFMAMRAGDFSDGEHVLRAKIDMQHQNLSMRDPVLYRIRHAVHHRTGRDWCIYPMYDYTHCLSDAFEGITHSLCSLEFENNRVLYDWVLEAAEMAWRPRQIEFSRLQLEHTVLSKRHLNLLINEGCVAGWDDPRLPTLSGLRRRGVPAGAILELCNRAGITKKQHRLEVEYFEHHIRQHLGQQTKRAFAVTRPLLLIIDNWSEDKVEWLDAPWHPKHSEMGTRPICFARELYIEQDDFMLEPAKDYRRLAPGRDVRLRYGYIVRCNGAELNADGSIKEVHCSFYSNSRSGQDSSKIKASGVIHWLESKTALPAQLRFYNPLFENPDPESTEDISQGLNPQSLELCDQALIEPAVLKTESAAGPLQFERVGYFIRDPEDAEDGRPVFNRTVSLRDGWTKKG